MKRLSKRHFWEWFRRHHQEFQALENKSKKEIVYWFNELSAHLRAYYKYLHFVLESDNSGGSNTLVITVEGNAKHFKKVDDLLHKAIDIAGWKFEALEGPRPIDYMLEDQILKTGIDPTELYFCLENHDTELNLILIYHPMVTEENLTDINTLARQAVYNLLGERSFGNDIFWGGVENLSIANRSELQKLDALPQQLAQSRSGILVDSSGNLVL